MGDSGCRCGGTALPRRPVVDRVARPRSVSVRPDATPGSSSTAASRSEPADVSGKPEFDTLAVDVPARFDGGVPERPDVELPGKGPSGPSGSAVVGGHPR
ncbi:hypothetical protein V2I01_13955 [Micromonospora sp. BRA006-A]|nr:hypothetical protein [Micromonospora sp. BRA006-A]